MVKLQTRGCVLSVVIDASWVALVGLGESDSQRQDRLDSSRNSWHCKGQKQY